MSTHTGQNGELSPLKRAFLALEETQAKLQQVEQARREPLAVIGLGCRFPGGAHSPEAFWHLLRDGADAIREVPADRWDVDAYYDADPDRPGTMSTRWGGFLDDVAGFDPQFFGIAPREAASMDPQQRLLLEVSWEALEHAGQAPDKLAGSRTGVFVGISTSDYAQLQLNARGLAGLDTYFASGIAHSVASGRLSYVLGLNGPSISIDTACSSSLVAVHLACQSLRAGECRLAIAGGVNLILSPENSVTLTKYHMMAPDGRCKAFDARADGFVRAEGCGIVVLKRLSDALADGDRVLAVIRGTAVNQDGASSGLTAPNGPSQEAVIREALANAGVRPHDVSYVEAHGTGTALGDPIEVQALGAVLGPGRPPDEPFMLGSVKTNVGHLETVAGVAGLIKTVLALQHGEIPPHLHLQSPNPLIPWEDIPVTIPTERTVWTAKRGARIAGVSSFGFSGTNAHVVVAEAPPAAVPPASVERPAHLLTLSARSAPALRTLAGRYAAALAAPSAPALPDLCYSANTGRAHFPYRLAFPAADPASLHAQLTAAATAEPPPPLPPRGGRSGPRVAFLFSGQGAQAVGMAHQLAQTQPTFRAALDRCAALLAPHLDRPLAALLAPDAEPTLLAHTAYTQPALFAVEYALAELWQSWGVVPGAVLGHSLGEYVAACVAGVLPLADALRLVAERGRLMGALPPGGRMTAVRAGAAEVAAVLAGLRAPVSLAAINGPASVVIAGAGEAVAAAEAALAAAGLSTQPLVVSHAFHSPLMEPMLDALEAAAATVPWAPPRLRWITNLSGTAWPAGEAPDAGYWRRQAREAVQFGAGIGALWEQGYEVFLEIGPRPTLVGLGAACVPAGAGTWLASLRPGRDDWEQLLETVGTLYERGVPIDWAGFDRDYPRRRVALPTYPFQRQRYWLDYKPSSGATRQLRHAREDTAERPLLGSRVPLAPTPGLSIWESRISLDDYPYLDDHRVQGVAIYPATGYLEMVQAAASERFGDVPLLVSNVEYHKAMVLRPGDALRIQVVFQEVGENDGAFRIYSQPANGPGSNRSEDAWTLHADGRLRHGDAVPPSTLTSAALDEIRNRCAEAVAGEAFYRALAEKGNQWGPAFRGVDELWRGDREAWSVVRVPQSLAKEIERYCFHPAVADACGHVLAATIPFEGGESSKVGAFVGGSIDEIRIYHRPRGLHLRTVARLRPDAEQEANVLVGDVWVVDESGAIVSETRGVRLWHLNRDEQRALTENVEDWCYEITWEQQPRAATPRSLPAGGAGRWLILADGAGVGAALARRLEAEGAACTVVRLTTDGEAPAADGRQAAPNDPDDVGRLLAEALHDGRGAYRGIVHLWSLDLQAHAAAATGPTDAQRLTCGSVLSLVQALSAASPESEAAGAPRLWLVTRGAQPVLDGAAPDPLQAPLWGLGRVIAREHPELGCACVDLDPVDAASLAADLFDEVWLGDRETEVALRGGDRYVARLVRKPGLAAPAVPEPGADVQPLRLAIEEPGVLDHLTLHPGENGAHPLEELPAGIRADGTYLITGGLGGLGLRVARRMVERGARHLVLLGRRAPTARAAETLRELEAAGARVKVVQADVACADAVARTLTDIAASMPPLRGVVHAAGVVDDGVLLQQDWTRFARVMAPKIDGSYHLDALTREQPLDFFVLFSSGAGLLGAPGQGNYAAANAFLDALAHRRRAEGRPALSVNWGPWSEAGMAAALDERDRRRLAEQGVGSIEPEQGLDVLERLLRDPAPQVAVLPMNWQRWQQSYPALVSAPFLSRVVQPGTLALASDDVTLTREELIGSEPADRRTKLEAYVATQAARVLHLGEAFDLQRPLSELGLDSLMAVELRNRLELDFGIAVPMVRFLEGPSVVDLASEALYQLNTLSAASSVTAPQTKTDSADARLLGNGASNSEEQGVARLLADVDQLTDDQMDSLLAELLTAEDSVS